MNISKCRLILLPAAILIWIGYASGAALNDKPDQCIQDLASGKSNQFYNAVLSLQKGPGPCCDSFSLRVVNSGAAPIEFMWDKTFYVHNGTKLSRLLPAKAGCNIAAAPQTTVIAPGQSFETPVWPAILSSPPGPSGTCSHFPMEAGQNGVFMTANIEGLEMSQTVSLDFSYACAIP
jgi:hypothetical protein